MNKGPLLVLTTYILWGVLPIFWKLLGSVDSFFILLNRHVWSFVLAFFLLVLARKTDQVLSLLKDRAVRRTLALSSLFLLSNWALYIYAVQSDHIIDASLAYYLNPLMSIFLAALVFKERLSFLQWLAVGLAFVGVLVFVVSSQSFPWLAILIGGTWAIYGALKKNVPLDGVLSLQVELTFTILPALVLVLWALSQGHVGTISGGQWALLPLTGLVTAVPLFVYANGIQTTDYALAGMLMYINPTMQFLIGVFLYGEPFTANYKLLFFFVWGALLLYSLGSFKGKGLSKI